MSLRVLPWWLAVATVAVPAGAQRALDVSDISGLKAAAAAATPVVITGTVARVDRTATGGSNSYSLSLYFVETSSVFLYVIPTYTPDIDRQYGREGLVGRRVAIRFDRLYITSESPMRLSLLRQGDLSVASGAADARAANPHPQVAQGPTAPPGRGPQVAQRASPFPEGDALSCQGTPGFLSYREDGIDTILKFANVTARDVVFDIGLNSGEVATSAARRLGARGVALPFCQNGHAAALDGVKRAGVTSQVSVRTGHFMDVDYREATVIVLTMIPMHNQRLFQKLARELRPGARVVSPFGAGDACPDRSMHEVTTIPWKSLHVWTLPLDCTPPAVRRPARRPEDVREPMPIRQPLIDALGRVEDKLPAPAEGIIVAEDSVRQLDILSGRVEAVIEALGPPPYEQFEDYVHILCGGETKGRAFECVSLWVGVDGFEIPAYSRHSSVVSYKTTTGMPAERRRANALFNAAALRWGFTVRYMSPDGTERVREVSEAEAANDLLLHVAAPSPAGPK